MIVTRRDSLKLAGAALAGIAAPRAFAQDLTTDKLPPRMPLDEFVRDADLMQALIRGVRAMKARKPSDPLSWFYQAAIHAIIKSVKKPELAAGLTVPHEHHGHNVTKHE